MKKVLQISIGQIAFSLEEDAYHLLKEYLEKLAQAFAKDEGASELMDDIEFRIAEILLLRKKHNKDRSIVLADVNYVIEQIGSVEEITGFVENNDFKGKESFRQKLATRKLYRDESDATFGGVCSGIGSYFNIDPIWIRLLMLLGVFVLAGTTIILYLILWIILPGKSSLQDNYTCKRFFRVREGRMIAGVCTGLGRYFSVDYVLVRVILLVLLLLGGIGLIPYIIIWFISPYDKKNK